MLQVDANARPGAEAPAHRVHEHVGGLEVRGRLRVARLPALDARERIVFLAVPAPISISGCFGTRRFDGATRGASPGCLR